MNPHPGKSKYSTGYGIRNRNPVSGQTLKKDFFTAKKKIVFIVPQQAN